MALALGSIPIAARGQSSSSPVPSTGRPPMTQRAKSNTQQAVTAVGKVLVRNREQVGEARARGSAVVISQNGLVVTNYHVVVQDKVERLFDEIYLSLSNDSATMARARSYRLAGVLMDREHDLALLRIVGDSEGTPLPPTTSFFALEMSDSRDVKLLDDLIIIGFPEKGGSTVTVSRGIVQGKDNPGHWIKTDAQLIRGNSGGAAINEAGQLVGIPTKVVFDTKRVDKDGDGFPDEEQQIGAVGFLRPAYLVAAMVAQVADRGMNETRLPAMKVAPASPVQVNGTIRTASGRPVAGARVGLVPVGSATVTADNLLAWGGTNADGRFALNKAVTPGWYTLKVKAVGYEAYSRDVEVRPTASQIQVELRAAQ